MKFKPIFKSRKKKIAALRCQVCCSSPLHGAILQGHSGEKLHSVAAAAVAAAACRCGAAIAGTSAGGTQSILSR